MRKIDNINKSWQFYYEKNNSTTNIDLPHTWNGEDGQDGGSDFYRGTCVYTKHLGKISLKKDELLYVEFKGVNSEAKVYLNDVLLISHEGGYSTFRADLTPHLNDINILKVEVCNKENDRVYPQRADFTFYGGIYRDVNLIHVNKDHFALDHFGGQGIEVKATLKDNEGFIFGKGYVTSGDVEFVLLDKDDKEIVKFKNEEEVSVPNVHLWNGLIDPYLYKVVARLYVNGKLVDEVSTRVGFRNFSVDPKIGFILNGKSYPLHGVSRHQDRPEIGNAISKKDHEEDIALIKEIGANTIRLAHYQHDDYFYDLCDETGFIIWAEIPYISKHMPNARENAVSQMKELVIQQYHHPSICFWGISNEITMMKTNKKQMLEEHSRLNELIHKLDDSRLTTLACFAMCGMYNKSAFISDVVGWNLYLGWYVPFLWLNKGWLSMFHLLHPSRPVCYSEYGAEAVVKLHSPNEGKRFDNSEEYQAKYHDYLIKVFAKRPYVWGTYVWNMFDFAADGRDQGGEPGMNHKGLVTFDRKIRKDAFYAYKVHWNEEKMIHLCGKRYVNRHERKTLIKVYSNDGDQVEVFLNGQLIETIKGEKVFKTKVILKDGSNHIEVRSNSLKDEMVINKVEKRDPSYIVTSGNSMSWEK